MSTLLNHVSLSYRRFSQIAQRDFKLALTVILVLSLYRLFIMAYFRADFQAQTTATEYLFALLNGMRYDAVVAGYISIIPFLRSLLSLIFPLDPSHTRMRTFFMLFFMVTAVPMLLSHFLYYMEYRENFSHLALTIIYDDAEAVVRTAWRQYPLGKGLLAALICAVLYVKIGGRFIPRPFSDPGDSYQSKPRVSFVKGLLYVLLFAVMIRGSFGPRPVEPKDGAVTSDQQLNNHVVNPYMALLYAVEGHIRMRSVKGIDHFLRGDTIENAVQRYFNSPSGNNLDMMMIRHATGTMDPPQHIFVIVMESMDAWNLLEKYGSFRLLPNLQDLGRDGALFRNFFPASSGTMTSLAAIVTGLPDARVVTNYQPSSRVPYATSIAPQFKQLGYRTRFFYGGYLSWQRIHDFCTDQGFEEIYGGGHIGNWKLKEWGVDDHILFEFVEKTLEDPRPSFNVILSTTYHSPYDIDIYQWGFPYNAFPEDIDTSQSTDSVDVFGHLWYTDKVVGNFLRSLSARNPSTLFAVTGDHRSHNYLSQTHSQYERVAVPLLLYGKGVAVSSSQSDQIAGSHMDIAATLLELSAPKGFVYHSLGSNLLDLKREQIGFGQGRVITPTHIIDLKGAAERLPFASSGEHDISDDSGYPLVQRLRDHLAIGWWRIMKGPDIP